MDLTRILTSQELGIEMPGAKKAASAQGGEAFAKNIGETLASANVDLTKAEESARELAAGKGDLVETMIAMGRADLSLRMVVNMRNRMLESYNEIMRLQV